MEDLPNYLLGISISFLVLSFILDVVFLVNWRRLRDYVRPYLKYGIAIATIITAFSLVDSYLTYKILVREEVTTTFLSIGETIGGVWGFFVLIAITVVGLHYAHILNNPQLPIVAPKLNGASYLDDMPARYQMKINREKPSISRIDWIFAVLTIAVASAIVEGLLSGVNIDFNYFSQDEEFQSMMQALESAETTWVMSLIGGLIAVFSLEVTFRLGVQNALSVWWGESEFAQWIAIVVASVLSALTIFMVSSSAWVFFFQVFIVGLGLGWLNKRYGIEASIIASLITFLIMMSLGLDESFTY